jgi:hypothetical protein
MCSPDDAEAIPMAWQDVAQEKLSLRELTFEDVQQAINSSKFWNVSKDIEQHIQFEKEWTSKYS